MPAIIHGSVMDRKGERKVAVPIAAEEIPGSPGEYAIKILGEFVPAQLSEKEYINHTTIGATAEDAWTPSTLTEARKVSIIVSGGDCYIAFDEVADATKFLLKDGEAYSESDIEITTKISIIRVSTDVQIRGIVWGV